MAEETRYDYINSLVVQMDNGELEENDAVELIDKWDDGKPLPKHLVTWEEKITIKKGGWNITRNYRAATLGGGWKNA